MTPLDASIVFEAGMEACMVLGAVLGVVGFCCGWMCSLGSEFAAAYGERLADWARARRLRFACPGCPVRGTWPGPTGDAHGLE